MQWHRDGISALNNPTRHVKKEMIQLSTHGANENE